MSKEHSSKPREPERDRLLRAAKHLLPFLIVVSVIAYWAAAYGSETRAREIDRFYTHAEQSLWKASRGRFLPPASDTALVDRMRDRFGVEDEEIPAEDYAVDPRGLAIVLCEEPIAGGTCPSGEARFRAAYPIHRERVGLDTWNVVFAPVMDGHFTRDPLRILYVARTAGPHYAALVAGPAVHPERDDAGIAMLEGFADSSLGEEIGRLTDDGGVGRLNPLGLAESEWRLHGDDSAHLPHQEEIYELTRQRGPAALSWLGGDGSLESALTRIALIGTMIALIVGVCRLLARFLAYTFKGLEPLALALLEQVERQRR